MRLFFFFFLFEQNKTTPKPTQLSEQKDAVSVAAFHVAVKVDHYKHNVNNDLLKRILYVLSGIECVIIFIFNQQ